MIQRVPLNRPPKNVGKGRENLAQIYAKICKRSGGYYYAISALIANLCVAGFLKTETRGEVNL